MNNRYESNAESLFVCAMLILSAIAGFWLIGESVHGHKDNHAELAKP